MSSNTPNMLKKVFLGLLIVTSVISAILYIRVVGGGARHLEKPFFSTFMISVFSLTGFCCTIIYNHPKVRWFSLLGVGLSIVGVLISLKVIWTKGPYALWGRPYTLVLIAGALAHISLLLLVKPKDDNVKKMQYITIGGVIATLLILLYVSSAKNTLSESLVFVQVVAVFCAFLGSVILPFMNRSANNQKVADGNAPSLSSQNDSKKPSSQRRGL